MSFLIPSLFIMLLSFCRFSIVIAIACICFALNGDFLLCFTAAKGIGIIDCGENLRVMTYLTITCYCSK